MYGITGYPVHYAATVARLLALLFISLMFFVFFLSSCSANIPISETAPSLSSSSSGRLDTASKDSGSDTSDGPEATSSSGPSEITLASFNTARCNLGKNVDEASEIILEKGIDIACLQEIDVNSYLSGYQDLPKLLSEKTGYEYYFFSEGPDSTYGTLILSKYPIKETKRFPLDSGSHEQRTLAMAVIDTGSTLFTIYNTHLTYEDDTLRAKQITFLTGKLRETGGVLAGDFNVKSLNELDSLYLMCSAANTKEQSFPTWKDTDKSWGCEALDHIFATEKYSLSNAQAVETGISDHEMLIAVISILK